MRDDRVAALTERVDTLASALEAATDRVDDLECERDRLTERVRFLEARLESTEDRLETTESRLEAHDNRLETCENHRETCDSDHSESAVDAALNKAGANKERIAELQARELEKGAHLRAETVDVHELAVPGDRLERVTKDDGRAYYRLPEHADPLERGEVSLAYGDLLPIQQLARMDEDMRRSAANALPTRLAAKLWRARTDDAVGDDPWERGCKGVDASVAAGDLRHWIRRREPGISEAYAKKLVSRVIDACLDLSKNRLAVHRQTQRKNGLEYTERRLVLPADTDIPGETTEVTERR